jgi:hypothetical protein
MIVALLTVVFLIVLLAVEPDVVGLALEPWLKVPLTVKVAKFPLRVSVPMKEMDPLLGLLSLTEPWNAAGTV